VQAKECAGKEHDPDDRPPRCLGVRHRIESRHHCLPEIGKAQTVAVEQNIYVREHRVVPREGVELGHFARSLTLQRRQGCRCNHSAAPVEEDHRAGVPDLQAREKSREPFQLDDDRDDAGEIEIYDDRRRSDDRRPIAIQQMREHAPARAVLCDGALVPGLRSRLVVARGDLAPTKNHVAQLGGVGVDPLLPNSRLGVLLYLDHVDLVVAGFERAEEGPIRKTEGNP
jgi:hypothetical protein